MSGSWGPLEIVKKERKKNFELKRFELFCYRTKVPMRASAHNPKKALDARCGFAQGLLTSLRSLSIHFLDIRRQRIGQRPWTTDLPAAGLSPAGKRHHFVDQKNCSSRAQHRLFFPGDCPPGKRTPSDVFVQAFVWGSECLASLRALADLVQSPVE
jgi:hypothetical protein